MFLLQYLRFALLCALTQTSFAEPKNHNKHKKSTITTTTTTNLLDISATVGLSLPTILPAPATTTTPTTAPTNTANAAPGSCASIGDIKYTDKKGFRYNVTCGTNLTGDELAYQPVANFTTCFNFCDNIIGCKGFSYEPGANGATNGAGNCYFYHVITSQAVEQDYDAAFMIRIIL